ncbi:MAG: HD-GYP domain-containing protein [Planctomycetota bacterium]
MQNAAPPFDGDSEAARSIPEPADEDLLALMDTTADSGIATVIEHSPGEYQLVIPLGDFLVATTIVRSESPGQLLGLAELGSRFFRQQAEVTQLREENDFFLKQVSDDFEELTFLRSMAERLGLGDTTRTIEQLVADSIPELGKSTHAEELYFVSGATDEFEIVAKWHTECLDSENNDETAVNHIVESFRQAARQQAVIKNAFGATELGSVFPGVRDFVLVTVGMADTPIGWFLAINRIAEEDEAARIPEWRLNQHEFGTSEASLLSTAAAMIASHSNNLELFHERELLLVNVVRTLVSAVEAKDQYTCGHSERVALYAKRLAQQIGYSDDACELLYLTGLLHDIGKIAINDAILNKPDRLSDDEFAEIQRHPEEGWKILQGLTQLDYVLPGVLHHHERVDGQGYPDHLAGNRIPRDGRILAVADAYDAMTSDRAYRTGMPHEKAMGILRDGAGTQWDAEAIAAFLQIEADIIDIRDSYRPREQPNRKARV